MIFNLGERGTNWLMFIWTLLIIYPFINPIIKIFQQNKKQLNYIFGMKNEINNTFILDDSEFTYKNDIFELKTTWENTKLLEIDTNFISFQTSVPSLQFWIPINKFTIEATELIKSQVSGK